MNTNEIIVIWTIVLLLLIVLLSNVNIESIYNTISSKIISSNISSNYQITHKNNQDCYIEITGPNITGITRIPSENIQKTIDCLQNNSDFVVDTKKIKDVKYDSSIQILQFPSEWSGHLLRDITNKRYFATTGLFVIGQNVKWSIVNTKPKNVKNDFIVTIYSKNKSRQK